VALARTLPWSRRRIARAEPSYVGPDEQHRYPRANRSLPAYTRLRASAKTKAHAVRIPAEMIERIDKIRNPLIPREAYIRDPLDKALKAQARKQH
jgi:hypothetical protein